MWIPLVDKPVRHLELVSTADPAFDREATTDEMLEAYDRTHDRLRLSWKANATPIVFHVETLSDMQLAAMETQVLSAVRVLPDGTRVQATASSVLDQLFSATVKRIVAPVWDPDGGHRVAEVPREKWLRIPAAMRLDVAAQVRQLCQAPEVPAPETDPGN